VASFSGPFLFYRGTEQNSHPFDEKNHCRIVAFLLIINNYPSAKKNAGDRHRRPVLTSETTKRKVPVAHYFTPE